MRSLTRITTLGVASVAFVAGSALYAAQPASAAVRCAAGYVCLYPNYFGVSQPFRGYAGPAGTTINYASAYHTYNGTNILLAAIGTPDSNVSAVSNNTAYAVTVYTRVPGATFCIPRSNDINLPASIDDGGPQRVVLNDNTYQISIGPQVNC